MMVVEGIVDDLWDGDELIHGMDQHHVFLLCVCKCRVRCQSEKKKTPLEEGPHLL